MTFTKFDALRSLKPNGVFDWIGTDYSGLTGSDKPTEAELDAEVLRLQTEYDNQDYRRKREQEYPSVVDQLDDIYHNGLDAWKATIKVTKDKYPKP